MFVEHVGIDSIKKTTFHKLKFEKTDWYFIPLGKTELCSVKISLESTWYKKEVLAILFL